MYLKFKSNDFIDEVRNFDDELYLNSAQLGYGQFQSVAGSSGPNNKDIDIFNQQLANWESGNSAALLAGDNTQSSV